MDELEISGRRFISTKRAAKEHKYHADYIGQLVRGKKVVGQKVGRSWYVDAESLDTYLRGEATAPSPRLAVPSVKLPKAPVAQKHAVPKIAKQEVEEVEEIEEVEPEPAPIVAEEIEEPVVEEVIEEKVIEQKVKGEAPITLHIQKEVELISEPAANYAQEIPLSKPNPRGEMRGGLRYVDEPSLLPPLQKQPHALNVMPRASQSINESEAEGSEEILVAHTPRKKRSILSQTTTLLVAGGLALIISAAAASLLISTTHVVSGQPASVNYSISADSTSF